MDPLSIVFFMLLAATPVAIVMGWMTFKRKRHETSRAGNAAAMLSLGASAVNVVGLCAWLAYRVSDSAAPSRVSRDILGVFALSLVVVSLAASAFSDTPARSRIIAVALLVAVLVAIVWLPAAVL